MEDCYPTIVTLRELHAGPLTPTQLKDILEMGGLSIKVTLAVDAGNVIESLSSKDLKEPMGCTLGAHQLDTTIDGARHRALCAVVRHSRCDCGRPHQRGHRQRCAFTSHGRNAILQARPRTTHSIQGWPDKIV
eukprot:6430160-Pyramimonas_sp.AAC.1